VRLVADFVGHVRRADLLRPGDRVVVACSGGADSVALAHLAARSARRLGLAGVVLAHLDHALRPGSRDDAAFVAALAKRLGLPLVAERRAVRKRRGESPEAAARRVRYAFLERAAEKAGADVVATAHHMDDQAETVLLAVLRGTGPRGLAAMAPSRALRRGSKVRLVRPLLPFRRERLREWLARWSEPWREDPTNEAGNVRALLRSRAMPVLRECAGRDPVPLLARLAENARDAESKRPCAGEPAQGRGGDAEAASSRTRSPRARRSTTRRRSSSRA
jgi:tRNA(Ile)-lysidine synthase